MKPKDSSRAKYLSPDLSNRNLLSNVSKGGIASGDDTAQDKNTAKPMTNLEGSLQSNFVEECVAPVKVSSGAQGRVGKSKE